MTIIQIIISIVLSIAVLVGISMMSKVRTAVNGNLLSALAMLVGVIATLLYSGVLSAWTIYPAIIIGALIGAMMAQRVKMIQMPQMVALFNGLGGGASALVGILSATMLGFSAEQQAEMTATGYMPFVKFTAMLAIAIGTITLVGSLIAAGKLHRVLPQKPVVLPNHSLYTIIFLLLTVGLVLASIWDTNMTVLVVACIVTSCLFGVFFSIRVGGADMPITISLLNSLSGVAGAIAGMAISDIFLVAVGGIVGASGLLLTQIMCRAMNRSLMSILLGGKAPVKKSANPVKEEAKVEQKEEVAVAAEQPVAKKTAADVLAEAKDVIIVPGYGMALAQAQHQVKQLADLLEGRGARVRYAIHPVAGRMPGHMNVLLAEADVPYEQLYEMDQINDDFKNADVAIVIGASDVLNPAARNAEGTPIYGMPVLSVDEAPQVVICNYDLKPGYAGVENPLYSREQGVYLELGDAKETIQKLISGIHNSGKETAAAPAAEQPVAKKTAGDVLAEAKDVIIVPGYGMALAQAQHQVKQLADLLEGRGARVRYAIHPVAGRMPGHMNVLLAEADVPYEQLYEMDQINDDFKNTDVAIVIGASDVLNPAARNAEGTPIYGMPVLSVDEAPQVVICNYDLKPGYAGVENPLYSREQGVYLELGDAKETIQKLISAIHNSGKESAAVEETKQDAAKKPLGDVLKEAKDVIIVPGYGMALAQAQHQVKQLADLLEGRGARVRYAIHPVAGRMPGHMNVLLAEADVPYEQLYEMDQINDDFKNTDVAIVIGASDVLNPAARNAEGTPIYGMPVLSVDEAPQVVICNYDLKPGYAGVENPLYSREQGVYLELGDAKETLKKLVSLLH